MGNSKNRKQETNPRYRNQKRKQVSEPSTSQTFDDEDIGFDELETQRTYQYLQSIPPGYMFNPTDTMLVRNYLQPKIANQPLPRCLIHPVNIYRYHPRTLADKYLKHPDVDCEYYFSPRNRKYLNGDRPNRAVEGIGYWKANGKDVEVKIGEEVIGYKKTLGFYEGNWGSGNKTNWIMHEYKSCIPRQRTSDKDMKLDDWVLCKIRENKETGLSKKKKNKEDTEIENVLIHEDAAITDYDKEDNRRNGTSYDKEDNGRNTDCGTSYHNQFTNHGETVDRLNIGYSGTSYEEDYSRQSTGIGTSYHNQIIDHGEEVYGPSFEDQYSRRNTDCGTCYHNQIIDYGEEVYCSNANHCSTSYNNEHQDMEPQLDYSSLPPFPESYGMISDNYPFGKEVYTCSGTSYHNQIIDYGEEVYCPNANHCSTSYNNDLQDMGPMFDDGVETRLIPIMNSYNFQDNNSGLQIKDANDANHMQLPKI